VDAFLPFWIGAVYQRPLGLILCHSRSILWRDSVAQFYPHYGCLPTLTFQFEFTAYCQSEVAIYFNFLSLNKYYEFNPNF